MHERGLDVDAQEHAEPHEIDAQLRRHGCQQRDQDECDLEEVEEEGEEEDEHVDEDEKTHHAPRHAGEQVLQPRPTVDALKDQGEDRRSDEDEDHHGGESHRRLHALPDQCPGQAPVHRGDHHAAHGPHGAGFGGRRDAHEDRSQHQENQDDRWNHPHQHLRNQRPAKRLARFLRYRWHPLRAKDGDANDVGNEQQRLHDRGTNRSLVHVAHRLAELVGEHDEHQRRWNELGDGPRGRNHPGCQLHVVAVAHHDRQGNHPHRDHGGRHGAGDGPQNGTDDDDREGQATGNGPEQLPGSFQQVFGQTTTFEDRAHERKERDRQQEVVRKYAEDAQRQAAEKLGRKHARRDRHQTEAKAERGQGEGDRVADQHHDHQAREHQRGHQFLGDHWSGFS